MESNVVYLCKCSEKDYRKLHKLKKQVENTRTKRTRWILTSSMSLQEMQTPTYFVQWSLGFEVLLVYKMKLCESLFIIEYGNAFITREASCTYHSFIH